MAKAIKIDDIQNQKAGFFALTGTGTSAAAGFLLEVDNSGNPVSGGIKIAGTPLDGTNANSWRLLFKVDVTVKKHFILRVRGWNRRLLPGKKDSEVVGLAAVSKTFDVTP
jgi:hypothetical protein